MPTTTLAPERAEQFLDLLERGDLAAAGRMFHEDATWITPLTATGRPEDAERLTGRQAIHDRLAVIASMLRTARFVDRRISVTADGRTTFVQTNGDCRTVAGEPYRNVYVFRLDWRDGMIANWEEYANPITIGDAFPQLASDADG